LSQKKKEKFDILGDAVQARVDRPQRRRTPASDNFEDNTNGRDTGTMLIRKRKM